MKEILLKLDRVSVQLSNRVILEAVSLELGRSEIVTVIGPNGVGKSTLVKVALGLLKPAQGTV